MKLKRVGEPVPSPDGKWVVFAAEEVDLEANTKNSHLWIVPAAGGEARRLNPTPNNEETAAVFAGRHAADLDFESDRSDANLDVRISSRSSGRRSMGQPRQVTKISTGADGGIWSPDGKNIVFVSSVYPDCKDDAENKQRDEELKKSKVKAKIFTKLLLSALERVHRIQAQPSVCRSARRRAASRMPVPRDLTPGDHDVPPFNLGGQDMYAISPDGQEVAYTSNIDEVEATSTNNEIFLVPMAGGAPKKISTSPGNDSHAALFARWEIHRVAVAWRARGFEADK